MRPSALSLAAALVLAVSAVALGSVGPAVASSPPAGDSHAGRLGPAPLLEAGLRPASERQARRADLAIIDTSSRAAVTAAFRERYLMNFLAPQHWTGDVARCEQGTISADYAEITLGLVNYYRNLAGLPGVTLASRLHDPSQAAALIMDANDSLTHSPPTDAKCYTSEGYEGASHANLCYNCTGPFAIHAYMVDDGSNNLAVGHRRWILYPPQTTLGTGSTTQADALYVIDGGSWIRPTDAPEWISWPPPGFVPDANIYPRFSLSRVGAGFGDATVRVTVDGKAIPAPVVSRATGSGDPAIVFELDVGSIGLDQGDRVFGITVDGIEVGGSTVSHSWQTTSFVPEVPGGTVDPDYHGFGQVTIGTSSSRTFTLGNLGNADLRLGSLYLEDDGGPFALTQDGCSLTTLGAKSSCTVRVTFTPESTGVKYTSLLIPSDAWFNPYGADLGGAGIVTPPKPTDVVATGISDSEVRVTWRDVDGETGYRVERAEHLDYVDASGPLGKDTVSFLDGGLRADWEYGYIVCAFNSKGEQCSRVVPGATLPSGPGAPTNVVATAISDTRIRLTWSDSDGEQGYRVRRYDGDSLWPLVGTVARNGTSFTNDGLTPGTDYLYTVCAFDDSREACSDNAAATTLPPGVIQPATIVVDDKHAGFRKYKTGWNKQAVGYARRSFWTTVRTSNVKRYARWQATLDAPGTYQVWVRYPKRKATTGKATYRILTADGPRTRTKSQKLTAGRWTKLGIFGFESVATVKLTDKTGERPASGRTIVFDVVRFVPVSVSGSAVAITVAPEVVEPSPLPSAAPLTAAPTESSSSPEPEPKATPTLELPDEPTRAAEEPTAEVKLRLHPKTITAVTGTRKVVSAWTCPADDRSPFGPDRTPGTADDTCDPVEADWRLEDELNARLNKRTGHKVLVHLATETDNRLVATYGDLRQGLRLTAKPRPDDSKPMPLLLVEAKATGESE